MLWVLSSLKVISTSSEQNASSLSSMSSENLSSVSYRVLHWKKDSMKNNTNQDSKCTNKNIAKISRLNWSLQNVNIILEMDSVALFPNLLYIYSRACGYNFVLSTSICQLLVHSLLTPQSEKSFYSQADDVQQGGKNYQFLPVGQVSYHLWLLKWLVSPTDVPGKIEKTGKLISLG